MMMGNENNWLDVKMDIDFDHLLQTPGAARTFAQDNLNWKSGLPPDAGIVLGLAIASQRVDVVEQVLADHPELVTRPCMNDGRFYQALGIRPTRIAEKYLVLSPAPVLPLTLACFLGEPATVAALLKAGAPDPARLKNPWGSSSFNPFALLVESAFDRVDRASPEEQPLLFDREGWTAVVQAFASNGISPLEKEKSQSASALYLTLGGLVDVAGYGPEGKAWCLPLLQLITRHCPLLSLQPEEESQELAMLAHSFANRLRHANSVRRVLEEESLLDPVPEDVRDAGGVIHSTIMATIIAWLQDAGLNSPLFDKLACEFPEIDIHRDHQSLSAALPVGATPVRASRL